MGREPGSAEMLSHMLDVTGVDARKVSEKTMHQLERTCSGCTDKMHCADEIGHGRAAQSYGEFCPNAKALQSLQNAKQS